MTLNRTEYHSLFIILVTVAVDFGYSAQCHSDECCGTCTG